MIDLIFENSENLLYIFIFILCILLYIKINEKEKSLVEQLKAKKKIILK